MKAWMFALLASLSLTAFAAGNPDQQEMPIEDKPTIEGNWEIQNRYCYSGAPVRDAFVPGRDTMELMFRNGEFRSFSDVQGCIGYSAGDYEVRRGQITLHIMKQVSTCSPDRFRGTVVNPYQLRGNRLTVTVGPIGYGGPCPQGDSLAVVYRRL